jgi:phosphoribosylanthranilate isomerase
MFVKICGITNFADAHACLQYGADAIGLNFYTKSKRFISLDDAAAIVREVSAYTTTIGVMVQPTIEDIARAIDYTEVDGVQVYEPKFEIGNFSFKKLLYYTARIRTGHDVVEASKVGADLIFLDSYVEDQFGGTGKASNWEEIAASGIDLSFRFVLSGGLNAQNVCDVIRRMSPYGVDTASGVELAPGKKDHEKIREFISKAKQCV